MKVELTKEGIIIVPETDFEVNWLTKFCPYGKKVEGFLKCGITPADIVGIKLEPKKEE